MFLWDILDEDEGSTIYKFLQLQVEQPTRGDWVSTCRENLKQLDLPESFNDIKSITRNRLKNILNEKIREAALKYLTNKQGQKGSEIKHLSIQIAEYLAPNSTGLTIEEKQNMFSVINRMERISYNFPNNKEIENCLCGQLENMEHIYNCQNLNPEKPELEYKYLFVGNLGQQILVYRRFKNNFEVRESLKSEQNAKEKEENSHHEIPCDPLYSHLYSNGFN